MALIINKLSCSLHFLLSLFFYWLPITQPILNGCYNSASRCYDRLLDKLTKDCWKVILKLFLYILYIICNFVHEFIRNRVVSFFCERAYEMILIKLSCGSCNLPVHIKNFCKVKSVFYIYVLWKQIKTIWSTCFVLLLQLTGTLIDLSSCFRCSARTLQSIMCNNLWICPIENTQNYCPLFQNFSSPLPFVWVPSTTLYILKCKHIIFHVPRKIVS